MLQSVARMTRSRPTIQANTQGTIQIGWCRSSHRTPPPETTSQTSVTVHPSQPAGLQP